MHWDDRFGRNPSLHAKCGIFGVHGEVATNWNEHQVWLVAVIDELHVAKEAGIAHVPNFESVFHLDDVTHRFTGRM